MLGARQLAGLHRLQAVQGGRIATHVIATHIYVYIYYIYLTAFAASKPEEKKRGSYWLQLGSGVGIDETAGSCRPLPAGSGIFATCMACTCRLLPALAGSCRLVVGHFQLVVLHKVFLHNLMSTGICKKCRLLPALTWPFATDML